MPGAYLRSTPYPILYKRSQDRVLSASASLSAYTSFNWSSWVPSFPSAGIVQHQVRAVQEIGT